MITVNELFSGIGAQRKALLRLGIPHEVVGVCEIDKYAIQSYEAIFGETYNYGDICTAPRLDYADLWTYSFPCQDISVAGNQKGINENTRSGLLYQVQRLLEVAKNEGTLPKYLLLENVKNLVGKKFKSQFDSWLFYLDELGYDTYWQVLNSKDYGIPQNRERVFAISIRKDLNQSFEFLKAQELTIRLKDVLEDEVDEKFYISQDKVQNLIKTLENKDNYVVEAKIQQVGNIPKEIINDNERQRRVYSDKGLSPVILARSDSPKILCVGSLEMKASQQVRRVYSSNGLCPTLDTMQGGHRQPKVIEGLRIRKLTPLECWRLMGFDDEDFYKAQQSGVSNTQLYKQAGNSIVVNVLEKIFSNLLLED